MDGDDFVAPTMYEVLYNKAQSTGADITVVQAVKVNEEVSRTDVLNMELYPYVEWNTKLLDLNNKALDDSNRIDVLAYEWGCVVWLVKKKSSWTTDCFFQNMSGLRTTTGEQC